MDDIFEFVANVLSETCEVDTEVITPETNIVDDLRIDSVDFLDAIYEIDKKYGIKMPVSTWIAEINEGKRQSGDYFVIKEFIENISKLVKQKAAQE